MADRWVEDFLATKKLNKPGGEAYRTLGRSFNRAKADKLISEAHKRGYGHQEVHGKIFIYYNG